MSDPLHLENPPIVEALVDIDCDLPPDLDFLGPEAAAKQKYGHSYPRSRKRFAELHEIKMSADASMSETSVKRALDAFAVSPGGREAAD